MVMLKKCGIYDVVSLDALKKSIKVKRIQFVWGHDKNGLNLFMEAFKVFCTQWHQKQLPISCMCRNLRW